MNLKKIFRDSFYKVKWLCHLPANMLNHNNYGSTNKIAEDTSLKFCKLGKYNYIARRCSLYNVEVGNYCCFGPDIHIGGMQHSYWWYSMSPLLSCYGKPVDVTKIGNDVWLGAGSIIKEGIKIGDGAVVGANSFVNKNVESFSIVIGSPAKHLKYRFSEDVREAIVKSGYWDKDPEDAKRILDSLNLL